ncbi:MAG: hypothetical protein FJ014_19620 [Chloroflexi bacterium]|nr:hypothetical protein [Chloroflexota bacterium]
MFPCRAPTSLAIAVVGHQPYLGLATALAGGVILGFVCMRRFEAKRAGMNEQQQSAGGRGEKGSGGDEVRG